MPLLDYTTSVPVSRTIAQIQAKLVEHGARAVMMEYDDRGRITALAFKVKMPNGELPIRLPIDAAATLRVLERQAYNREIPARYAKEEHAYRVAWRIIKDWVEAQLSLLSTEMVTISQLFLPYAITKDGRTVYETLAEGKFRLLAEGDKEQGGEEK